MRQLRHPRALLWWRYSASSFVATVASQLTFFVVYGLGAAPAVASVSAFFAGTVPNYLLNRRWTWAHGGKHRLRHLLPYAAVVIGTAVLAIFVTTAVDNLIDDWNVSRAVRTVIVSGSYLATYGVMFVLKFVLFDRYVFGGPARATRSQA
jgi:putative flippase GtrA